MFDEAVIIGMAYALVLSIPVVLIAIVYGFLMFWEHVYWVRKYGKRNK
jgi:hypothetical protein